jgi:hypothetical protein
MALLNSPSNAENVVTALLDSVGQLRQLQTLRLHLPLRTHASVVALQQLPLLRVLELHASLSRPDQSAADLRALPWLHRLHVVASLHATLEHRDAFRDALLRDGTEAELRALQWRELSFVNVLLTDETAARLPLLPSLERLQANVAQCRRFDFLATLPPLTALEMHLWSIEVDAWRNLVAVFAADGLARLCTLDLHQGPCTSDDLETILSHTPSLTILLLRNLGKTASLAFFQQLPKLAESLTQLTLECTNYWRLTVADLPPLLVLQQLRVLRLINWPNNLVDSPTAADRAPFEQRPCVVLPHLEVFEWKGRL